MRGPLKAIAATTAALVAIGIARAAAPSPAYHQPADHQPAYHLPADPLHSPLWAMHAERLFAGERVEFDQRVILEIPMIAENQHVFPVTIDARALPHVRRMIVLADLDPYPVAVDFTPGTAAPWLSARIKLDQRTPVRVAAQTADGVWHVSGSWVDAAGGGCSAPPASRARGDWAEHLGELRGALYPGAMATRLRFSVRHPMDTGLVENIPAYNIETVTASQEGQEVARLTVAGSVSEDPAFTLLLPATATAPVALALHDSNGRDFTGTARLLTAAKP